LSSIRATIIVEPKVSVARVHLPNDQRGDPGLSRWPQRTLHTRLRHAARPRRARFHERGRAPTSPLHPPDAACVDEVGYLSLRPALRRSALRGGHPPLCAATFH